MLRLDVPNIGMTFQFVSVKVEQLFAIMLGNYHHIY